MSDRDLDVVVFGGTGVTGRRVAAYLGERSRESGARWAAAGRDATKVQRVLAEEGVEAPEVIVADVGDAGSLARMAQRARVVLNLVGPYTLYGRPVVEACVAAGTHYADLTGEIPFVREIVDEFDAPAREAQVKLVQVCGFESLPTDLAIALAARAARERFGEPLATVDVEVAVDPLPGVPRASDMVSGGTIQSMFALARAEGAEAVLDPAALITNADAAAAVRHASPIALAPRRGREHAVIAPMTPAAFINPAVIQRSAFLAAEAEGRALEPFRFREGVVLGGGVASLAIRWGVAGSLSAVQLGLRSLVRASPARRERVAGALSRIAPSSGFGPASDRLEGWHWTMRVDASTRAGAHLTAGVDADGHPGYLATARMLGEAGLLLAEGTGAASGGCLTPAIALGVDSVARFEHARVRFALDV